jgi:hypothetical protein
LKPQRERESTLRDAREQSDAALEGEFVRLLADDVQQTAPLHELITVSIDRSRRAQ